ncbi:MAG: polyamine ABC transporter substrate-binding protein [Candidatus Endonucleobacter sp. (ex Gigantidas childressi)]|nr:polyamine ABC transporter substrate-binding protein [Candidatus Endonucleobacter sp. (ex Gigantidas childressi)]
MNFSNIIFIAMATYVSLAQAQTTSTVAPTTVKIDKYLHFYNWVEYIGPNTLKDFEKKTGIKTSYDVYDSNEVLQGKLLSGKSGFDLVSPSHDFYKAQIRAGAFSKLDKRQLPNWKNLDPVIMKKISDYIDEGNQYGIPYLWGTTGIGYNKQVVEKILGKNAPVDSWALVFEPENMKKLQQCGVAFLDAPTEILPSAIAYLGRLGDSIDIKDYQAAIEQINKVRNYVSYFHSSKIITDLANGDICVAIGWSGDMLMAKERAKDANNGVDIHYSIPKEGAAMWFDMLAIPADASNKSAAHVMLNNLMDPKVIADITNHISYANPTPSSKQLIDPEIVNNPGIYPGPHVLEKLFIYKELPAGDKKNRQDLRRYITQQWRKITMGGIDHSK